MQDDEGGKMIGYLEGREDGAQHDTTDATFRAALTIEAGINESESRLRDVDRRRTTRQQQLSGVKAG